MEAENTREILDQLRAMGVESYQELMPIIAEYMYVQGVVSIVGTLLATMVILTCWAFGVKAAMRSHSDGAEAVIVTCVITSFLVTLFLVVMSSAIVAVLCPEGAAIMGLLE